MDDTGILWRVLEGLAALILGLVTFVMKAMHADVKDLKASGGKCELELERFKTEVANTYAKDTSVQQSLGRLHDRIDEVSSDIKQILQRVK